MRLPAMIRRSVPASLAVCAAMLVSATWAAPARADGADRLMLNAYAAIASLDNDELGVLTDSDEPDVLVDKNLRLDGRGAFIGGGFRGTIQGGSGVRGGLGLNVFGMQGLELVHDPLARGVSIELGDATGVGVEAFFGKAFDA